MMESSDKQYYTDVQIIMDFMKLSFIIDDVSIHIDYRNNALELQKGLLDLLQVAQSNRMAEIYKKLNIVYTINQETLGKQQPDDNLKYNLILFYDSQCPRYKRMVNDWKKYKSSYQNNLIYNILDYDIRDIIYSEKKNIPLTEKQLKKRELFNQFKIRESPTIVSINLDNGNGMKMSKNITFENILNFVNTNIRTPALTS